MKYIKLFEQHKESSKLSEIYKEVIPIIQDFLDSEFDLTLRILPARIAKVVGASGEIIEVFLALGFDGYANGIIVQDTEMNPLDGGLDFLNRLDSKQIDRLNFLLSDFNVVFKRISNTGYKLYGHKNDKKIDSFLIHRDDLLKIGEEIGYTTDTVFLENKKEDIKSIIQDFLDSEFDDRIEPFPCSLSTFIQHNKCPYCGSLNTSEFWVSFGMGMYGDEDITDHETRWKCHDCDSTSPMFDVGGLELDIVLNVKSDKCWTTYNSNAKINQAYSDLDKLSEEQIKRLNHILDDYGYKYYLISNFDGMYSFISTPEYVEETISKELTDYNTYRGELGKLEVITKFIY